MSDSRLTILTGNANPELAQAVVDYLNISLGKVYVGRFSDGEVMVDLAAELADLAAKSWWKSWIMFVGGMFLLSSQPARLPMRI